MKPIQPPASGYFCKVTIFISQSTDFEFTSQITVNSLKCKVFTILAKTEAMNLSRPIHKTIKLTHPAVGFSFR